MRKQKHSKHKKNYKHSIQQEVIKPRKVYQALASLKKLDHQVEPLIDIDLRGKETSATATLALCSAFYGLEIVDIDNIEKLVPNKPQSERK